VVFLSFSLLSTLYIDADYSIVWVPDAISYRCQCPSKLTNTLGLLCGACGNRGGDTDIEPIMLRV
jgi:hypothetical protein